MATRLVTFLSDFGLTDPYVAEVKAVLLSAQKPLQLVDLCHENPAFNIEWAAFQLLRSYRYFPKGTIHLAIVDPGVGTSRRAVFVKTKRFQFVGPDNGLLKWAVDDTLKREGGTSTIYEIPVPPGTLPTFHGRDLFAPFIARILRGKKVRMKRLESLTGRPFPTAKPDADGCEGEILGFDRYGNAITSILAEHESGQLILDKGDQVFNYSPNYQTILPDEFRAVRGSHGFWEIAGSEVSAREKLKLVAGSTVFYQGVR